MTDCKNRKLDYEIQRRLRAAGVPLEAELQCAARDLKVRLTGESILFDLGKAGGTGLFVDCAITNCSSRPLTISDIDLTFPWEDGDFAWLCDPQSSGGKEYRFPSGWTFPRESVLNHRIFEDRRITADRVLCGFLLGSSMNSIPTSCSHGAFVSIKLSVIDHRDRPHSSELTVWVDRSFRTGRMRQPRAGAGVYEPCATRLPVFSSPDRRDNLQLPVDPVKNPQASSNELAEDSSHRSRGSLKIR